MNHEDSFLGLDLSTQSLTAVVIRLPGGVTLQQSIAFDEAYPSYLTKGGVRLGQSASEVFADPRMWAQALDDMLLRLKADKVTGSIRAIGVSAQQHGTVYLNSLFAENLTGLDPALPYHRQIQRVFSRDLSPVWMDSSTHMECREITEALGGPKQVARLTGSVATERFAGPQIRKFWKKHPENYGATSHIALVSSFLTSLLTGRVAPVDAGDGYGTNLADIRSGNWSGKALHATAPGLLERLPRLTAKDVLVGPVSPYLTHRFGFEPDTSVVVGSGDNPCSLVGLGLLGVPDFHAVSLGTSDTYFGYTKGLDEMERSEGHLFGAADGRFMALVCFKNGSLAREAVKNSYGLSWDDFSRILLETQPGNQGRIMLPYFLPEITPLVLKPGVRRFGGLTAEDVRGNVRAVAEAQAMAMYLHSGWIGSRPKRILVTAGGSENRGLLTVLSHVFGA
ncbi:MAG: FGGY family carbohydrate kinase [Desulfobacterota bacterium]|nr:FGGY family carbohydrate kinase [Thermodesulfobacteriota bacterium]